MVQILMFANRHPVRMVVHVMTSSLRTISLIAHVREGSPVNSAKQVRRPDNYCDTIILSQLVIFRSYTLKDDKQYSNGHCFTFM